MKRYILLVAITAATIKPNAEEDYRNYFAIGNEAFKIGIYDEAIDNFNKAIECNSNSPQPYFNLGLTYEQTNNKDAAIEAYKKAIELKPEYTKAYNQLLPLILEKKDIEETIKYMDNATINSVDVTQAALETARQLCEQEKFADSLKFYKAVVNANPDDIVPRFEYANSLNTTNHTEEALEHYLYLLTKRPNDSSILYNTAYTLKKLGRMDDAMPYYEATLKRRPDHAEAHFSLGLAYLMDGEFDKGWEKYEWRWQRGTQLSPRNLKQPRWDGTPLQGKKIIIHAEQGLGDTFQFVRYVKMVKEQYGGYVIFAPQSPLHIFALRCCPYVDKVIPLSQIFSEPCDVQIPLLSIPLVLKTVEKTIPTEIPYIKPEPALDEYWQLKLKSDTNFKVGICWQGNSKYSSPFLRSVVAAKSIPLEKFKPLLETPGVSFYSLQKQTGEDQLTKLQDLNIKVFDKDFDNKHGRFMDTIAVIKQLDLVITIDTSISHLTGSLGKSVWVMVPEPADWRWMLKRTDSPWYPNIMRLFRQPKSGDWDTVIATITQELHKLLGNNNTMPTRSVVQKTTLSSPKATFKKDVSNSNDLQEELKSVNEKMKQLRKVITASHISVNDTKFTTSMKQYSLLSEIRSQILEKMGGN